jgi:hypothetical protein
VSQQIEAAIGHQEISRNNNRAAYIDDMLDTEKVVSNL